MEFLFIFSITNLLCNLIVLAIICYFRGSFLFGVISMYVVHQWRVHEHFLLNNPAYMIDSMNSEFGHINQKVAFFAYMRPRLCMMHLSRFKCVSDFSLPSRIL